MVWRFVRRHAWWLIPLLVFDVIFVRWWWSSRSDEEVRARPVFEFAQEEKVPPRGLIYTYPTGQTDLWDTESVTVFQPTASGRVESALYGSTRTRSFGGRLLPAFHMGIDIASMRRDSRGRPLDEVYAAADGRVVYINRVGGNSNYGVYVVVTHEDPVGEIYTLYSHLARVERGLKEGQSIARGEVLGIMGNTASTGIPMSRAHLHFEVGVINNARFHAWYRAQELVPDHGKWHGHNLTGIDPLSVLGGRIEGDAPIHFSMKNYLLREARPAFSLVVQADRPLDYFRRYPALWQGDVFAAGPIVLTATEGGVLMSGRLATAEEGALLGNEKAVVLDVDAEVLGRNGRRLVQQNQDRWVVGRNGPRWLEILMY